jgi:transcriptional regulator with XRE-family HTH domain
MLGAAVAARRNQLGLTQEQLAEKVGVSRITIAHLETGIIRWPKLATLQSLSRALETTITALLREGGLAPGEDDLGRRIAEFAQANPKFAAIATAAMDDPEVLRRFYEFVQMYQGGANWTPVNEEEEGTG